MKTARGVTRTAHLLGAMLITAGCADNGTAPPRTKTPTAAAIDLTQQPTLKAVVQTVINYRDAAGKIQERRFSQNVTATFKLGFARAKVDLASADRPSAAYASVTDGIASFAQAPQYSTNPAVMTPVLAVTSGQVSYNYADTRTDSVGNVFEFYAWAPNVGTPITDSWGYRNGILIVQYHASWTATTGGYLLATQKIGSYLNGATLAGTITSTVTPVGSAGRLLTKNEEPFGAKPLRLALNKLGCWLSPQVAYAQALPDPNCLMTGINFGLHTFTLGEMTVSEFAFVAPSWYLLEWGIWTQSMYEHAACLTDKGKGTSRGGNPCRTSPKLCTNGGGGLT